MIFPGYIASFPLCLVPGFSWYALLLAAVMGMGCGWPCCGDCDICSDDWTGIADGTDVSTGTSCGWTEDAGSWSVASNKVTTSSTSAILRSTTVHPDGTGEQEMQVTVTAAVDNTLVRFIVAYVDSTHYHFCEIKITSAATGYVRLYKKSGAGAPTLLRERASVLFNAATNIRMNVCLTDSQTVFTAYEVGNAFDTACTESTTVPASASGFGFGTGATVSGAVTFDSFTISSTKDDCPDCTLTPNGGCFNLACEDTTFPDRVQVDLAGIVNDDCISCTDLNATYIFTCEPGVSFARLFFSSPICPGVCVTGAAFDTISISFASASDPAKWDVEIQTDIFAEPFYAWLDPDSPSDNCLDWDGSVWPYDPASDEDCAGFLLCDFSASTATVTALALE